MKPNADLTIYHKGVNAATRSESWTIAHVFRVFWEENRAANVIKSGLLEADRVTVYVPFSRGEMTVQPGDVIVRGLVTEVITDNFTMSDLRAKYPASAAVRSVDRLDRGSLHLRHWQIGAA